MSERSVYWWSTFWKTDQLIKRILRRQAKETGLATRNLLAKTCYAFFFKKKRTCYAFPSSSFFLFTQTACTARSRFCTASSMRHQSDQHRGYEDPLIVHQPTENHKITTPSVLKYKYLLTSAYHVWPFVLFKKFEKILFIFYDMFYHRIYLKYILIVFIFSQIFWIRRMVKHDQQKSINTYILGRR